MFVFLCDVTTASLYKSNDTLMSVFFVRQKRASEHPCMERFKGHPPLIGGNFHSTFDRGTFLASECSLYTHEHENRCDIFISIITVDF